MVHKPCIHFPSNGYDPKTNPPCTFKVEVKPEMIGHYLGEFSISYKPVSFYILLFSFVEPLIFIGYQLFQWEWNLGLAKY